MAAKGAEVDLRERIQGYVGEFIGTFVFCTVICWVMYNAAASTIALAGGSHVAVIPSALVIGSGLAVVIYMIGAQSGGHVNPAVSLAFFLTGKIDIVQMLGYWVCQVLGALAAGQVCYAALSDVAVQNSGHINKPFKYVNAGYPARNDDFSSGAAVAVELLGTMSLVLVVLNVATVTCDQDGNPTDMHKVTQASTFAFVIGMSVTAWAVAAGAISGGAFNPAVGMLPIVWGEYNDVWVYWVGPLLGSICASLIFMLTNRYELGNGFKALKACEFPAYFVKLFNEFLGTMLFCIVISLTVGCKSKVNMLNGYAIGCMLMCMVYMGGHLSGGVYNPAVAFALFIRNLVMKKLCDKRQCCGHLLWDFIGYAIAQSAGALAGGGIVKLITDDASCQTETECIGYGYPDFGTSKLLSSLQNLTDTKYDFGRAFLAESLGTYILCLTVLHSATCQKKNINNGFYGLAIGFSVMIGIYAFGDISGGCFNPAVGLLDVLDSSVSPERIKCYWSAPFAGAFVAALSFMLLNPDEEEYALEDEDDCEAGEEDPLVNKAQEKTVRVDTTTT